MAQKVGVTLVTYNSARYIRACLEAVLCQEDAALDVVVVDNASADGTLDALAAFGPRIRVIRNARNLGFAAAQNQAIAAASGDWVLALNPDVLLRPGFIAALVAAGRPRPARRAPSAAGSSPSARISCPRKGPCSIPPASTSPQPCGTSTAAGTSRTTAATPAWSTSSAPAPPPPSTAAK